jgi:hypothetical protein
LGKRKKGALPKPDFRWKYQISVDVEATMEKARQLGFRVVEKTAFSTKGVEFPLGMIDISGKELDNLRTHIQITSNKTQVYSELPDAIDKVESLLNQITVKLIDEEQLFSKQTRIEIQTQDYLKHKSELISIILQLQDEAQRNYKRKIAYAELTFKGEDLSRRLDEIHHEEMEIQRSKLQAYVDLEISGSKDKLKKYNECMEIVERWNREYSSAQEAEKSKVNSQHKDELNRLILEGFFEG